MEGDGERVAVDVVRFGAGGGSAEEHRGRERLGGDVVEMLFDGGPQLG